MSQYEEIQTYIIERSPDETQNEFHVRVLNEAMLLYKCKIVDASIGSHKAVIYYRNKVLTPSVTIGGNTVGNTIITGYGNTVIRD